MINFKSLVSLLSKALGLQITAASQRSPAGPARAQPATLFAAPADNELSTLNEYVEAARAAAFLLERIRQTLRYNPELEPSDTEAVLARFERAERCLSGIGYAPILPRAFTRIPRAGHVHDVYSMVVSGMLRRRPVGKLPIFYANGLRRNVETLLKQGLPRTIVS